MKTSRAGIDLLKQFEGCRLKAYQDGGGVWTIGYGLTTAAGLMTVQKGLVITQEQANELLRQSLGKYEAAVSKALKHPPNQNQYDAMVSLCYNIGPGAFAVSSVARNFNAGNLTAAANAFLMWVKDNGKTIPGLVKRRELEKALFLKPSQMATQPDPTIPDAIILEPVPEPVTPRPRGLLTALIDLLMLLFKRRS